MLTQLSIRDIVLIDRLDLSLGSGMTVLTGETGAGKSILLDAFALALGGRGDGGLVREGQAQGQVTAVFDLAMDHPARLAAQAQDIDVDGDLILRRIQMKDGRTRAFVNDQPLSAQAMRAIARPLVEIHGQHDDRAMVEPALHRTLVDTYGGLQTEVMLVSNTHQALQKAKAERAREQKRIEKARADADYLRHAHAELSALAVEAGEEERLAIRRTSLMQAEKVTADLRDAQELLGGEKSGSNAILPQLASAMRRLQRREAQAPDLIAPSVRALDHALNGVELASQALEEALRAARFDPRELEQIEERLFALRAAGRKYSVPVDGLPALAERYSADLQALDAGEALLVTLAAQEKAAETAFDAAALALSVARKAAAQELDAKVNAELAPLKLERARFLTQVTSDPATGNGEGIDHVEFWVQTNPGTKPGPLMKVASGGELARFMLALKVVLAERGSAPTLVFDEIDTGVGGAVADAIGQRLARLAARVQVLAVTHAPQVAARAIGHFCIAKDAIGHEERVATRISVLADGERREEIARMLSGATITDEARHAAQRLIEGTGA